MSLDLLLLLTIILALTLSRLKFSKPTPNSATRPCARCGKLTSLRCSRCHDAYYCSSEHMAADWANHRVMCRKTTRPILRALLFPVDAATPVLVDIPYTRKIDTERVVAQPYYDLDSATIRHYLRGLEMKYLSRTGNNEPLLDHALVVMYGSSFLLDGSPLNRCIAALTGGRMSIPWAGNVLVLRQKGPLYSEVYEDASMTDVAAMSKFFEEYRDIDFGPE